MFHIITRHGLRPVKQAYKEVEVEKSGFKWRVIIAEEKNTRSGPGYDDTSVNSITRCGSFKESGPVCVCEQTASSQKLLAVIFKDKFEWKNPQSLCG